MITEAYIAGSIKKAIFKEGTEYFILEKSSENNYDFFPINKLELSDFKLAKPEINCYYNIKWERQELYNELDIDAQKQEALNFFIMGMDKTLSFDLRTEVIELLSQLITKSKVKNHLRNRIFSTNLPAEFDPSSASQISEQIGNEDLYIFYKDLSYANKFIITVREAWKKTLIKHEVESDFNLEILDKEFTDRGIFSDLVLALLYHNYREIDNSILKYADILKELKLRQPALFLVHVKQLIFSILSIDEVLDRSKLLEIEKDDKKYDTNTEDIFAIKFNNLIDNFIGKTKRKRASKKWEKIKQALLLKNYDPERQVNEQVAWIKDKIRTGKINPAENAILKLIQHQDLFSDAEHLCKSLCDIAQSFQDKTLIDHSNLLAEKAASINSKDPVPLCIIAENFRTVGQLKHALYKYESIINSFPNVSVPQSGKAETLRQMGKLNEALQQYEKTIQKFPKDVIARCGQAETLRQMGKLDEALQQYERTIQKFPNDVIAQCGKAETLRQMGKLDKALRQYEKTIVRFPDDTFSQCGKAETLRQMGNLENALRQYELTIQKFPYNKVAQCGKAETLRQFGKLDHALKQYDLTIKNFPFDVVAKCGKAETLRHMGKLDQALKQYELTINEFPNDRIAQCGKAETLRQMEKLDLALMQYEWTRQKFPKDVVVNNGLAETLRQMGRLDEALNRYDQTILNFPNNVIAQSGKAETLRQMGKLTMARKIYDDLIHDFPYDQIVKRSRLILLIQLGENIKELKMQTAVLNPKSTDDWILNHIHCMLLIKEGNIDEAIDKLKYGLKNIQNVKEYKYYSHSLSYAYIKKKQFKQAVSQLKKETNPLPIFKVLVTHAYAADGKIAESKKNFNLIFKSQLKKIDEVSKRLSDRYKLLNQSFFINKSMQILEKEIEDAEFDLLTESYLSAA